MLNDRALTLLRTHSRYGRPLEYHCERLYKFAIEIGRIEGIDVDEDLVRAACYLHDIGLCVTDESEKNYLKRGARFVEGQIEQWQLNNDQHKMLRDALLYNHSLSTIDGIHPQAELIRRAVSVEHSLGRIRQGLPKLFIRSVFRQFPRRGFAKVLVSFFKIAMVDDSLTELFRVFFPSTRAERG